MIFEQIKSFLDKLSEPDYRYQQILTAVFENRIGKFNKMTTLSKNLREKLEQEFGSIVKIEKVESEKYKDTQKILFGLEDGNQIETVKMSYQDKKWQTLCLSSQAGCGLGCKFCATGQIGFQRNLTCQEIFDQVLYFHLKGDHINNLVFMGMGEPFVNPHLWNVLEILTNPEYFNFSPRKISVSTVGIVPGIVKLTKKFPQVNLAFSLHTPIQKQREDLMPIAKQYSIKQVMSTLDKHIRKTNRKVFIPYLMIKGVTDTDKHLKKLKDLLLDKKRQDISYLYHLNLITYHHSPLIKQPFRPSSKQKLDKFTKEIEKTRIGVTVRKSFGEEIQAACGQLAGTQQSF